LHQIAADLRGGKVQAVLAPLKRLHPKSAELRESLAGLIPPLSQMRTASRYRLRVHVRHSFIGARVAAVSYLSFDPTVSLLMAFWMAQFAAHRASQPLVYNN